MTPRHFRNVFSLGLLLPKYRQVAERLRRGDNETRNEEQRDEAAGLHSITRSWIAVLDGR